MIVDYESSPRRSLYYIGAQIIMDLFESPDGSLDLMGMLKHAGKGKHTDGLTPLEYYMLAADWLFLLGLVEINHKGDLQKCF